MSDRNLLMNDETEDTLQIRKEISSFKKEDQDLLFNIIDYIMKNENKINEIKPRKLTNKEKRVIILENQQKTK